MVELTPDEMRRLLEDIAEDDPQKKRLELEQKKLELKERELELKEQQQQARAKPTNTNESTGKLILALIISLSPLFMTFLIILFALNNI